MLQLIVCLGHIKYSDTQEQFLGIISENEAKKQSIYSTQALEKKASINRMI